MIVEPIPFGVADIKRRGDDVTIVATSFVVQPRARGGRGSSRRRGSAPRSWTRARSCRSTARRSSRRSRAPGGSVVVDEGHHSGGVGAEIAATIAEEGFESLRAPVRRVATLDVPIPFSPPLEAAVEATTERIVHAASSLLG